MEVELTRPDDPAMTFDEVSMESRKSFTKALQELKNLRPQLYSAAKYSEKSFHHSEVKQIVLENIKDYAAKALVNTVDHLGTVASKLTDLLEQQTLEVSTMELKASCLNQQHLICQTYLDKEGLRQQQVSAFVPRHHKHYILPESVNKKLSSIQRVQTNPGQIYFQAKSLLQPSDTPVLKPLSWHLASKTNSTLNGTSQTLASNEVPEPRGNASKLFQLSENGVSRNKNASATAFPASPARMPTLSITHKELEGSKPSTAFRSRSFDNQKGENIRAPVRGKKGVAAFFGKQKAKLKALHILHEHTKKGNEGERGY
ncbi:hypothetical protein V6N13_100265 [Hibiscus sabdariffa]|uniref:Protein ABIL1 n=1 Tax=Hibiscus sabdariffa TaxID=183260 RepID=A0ABR2B7M1_9ROSI